MEMTAKTKRWATASAFSMRKPVSNSRATRCAVAAAVTVPSLDSGESTEKYRPTWNSSARPTQRAERSSAARRERTNRIDGRIGEHRASIQWINGLHSIARIDIFAAEILELFSRVTTA
jgi:hypothetical protein